MILRMCITSRAKDGDAPRRTRDDDVAELSCLQEIALS
jgi:hypothetical protein